MPAEAARQRRLPAADRVPLGAVGRVAPHRQRLLDSADGARRRATTTCCSSATCATPGGTTTRIVDAAIGTFIEYGTKDRRKDRESYAEMWRRWIYEDYYRSYLVPLEKYGLKIPHDLVEEAWNRIWNKGYVHEVAQFFATGWLGQLLAHRPDDGRGLRVVRVQVPGLVQQVRQVVGALQQAVQQERARARSPSPRTPTTVPAPLLDLHGAVPDPRGHAWSTRSTAQVRTYCSRDCRWTDEEAFRPSTRAARRRRWAAQRQARVGDALPRLDLADVVQDMGYVRDDGKTLVAAAASGPRPEKMWTLDHVPRLTMQSPNMLLNEMTPEERDAVTIAHQQARGGGGRAGRPAPTSPSGATAGTPRPPPWRSMARPKHVVRLEPVGIEMEVDEGETVLEAAFRQGLMLMHGCKEGQCASCKSFLLDGEDIELDKYSTFALPDFEEAEGFTLLCRAHAYSDLEIELLQLRRGDAPIGHPDRHRAPTRIEAIDELTHDIRRLVRAPDRATIGSRSSPASTSTSRCRAPTASTARSRWPTRPRARRRLEFIIKLYPGGLFCGLLAADANGNGSRLATALERDRALRRLHPARRLDRGGWCSSRGGAGMAPDARRCCARWPSGASTRQATFYYGARTRAGPVFERRAARSSEQDAARLHGTSPPCQRRGRGTARPA